MTRYPASLIITALSVLGGCGNTTPDVTTLMTHGNCEGLVAGVSEIRFEELAGIRGSQLLLLEDGINAAAPSPNPDFRLIAIAAGTRPTPGYALELGGARFEGATLVLDVVLNEPPADAILAQVTTHPCLIVATSHQRVPIEVHSSEGMLGSLRARPTSEPASEKSGQ
jgi:hypothetical protein